MYEYHGNHTQHYKKYFFTSVFKYLFPSMTLRCQQTPKYFLSVPASPGTRRSGTYVCSRPNKSTGQPSFRWIRHVPILPFASLFASHAFRTTLSRAYSIVTFVNAFQMMIKRFHSYATFGIFRTYMYFDFLRLLLSSS